MSDSREPSLEDYTNYEGAIAEISSMRDQFKIVSGFMRDPKGAIAAAKKEYDDQLNQLSPYKRALHKLNNIFAPLASHQAEVSLLLNIKSCVEANRELADLCNLAAELKPGDEGYSYSRLRDKMTQTGAHVVVWSDHVRNGLDVLRGNEKSVKVFNQPS